MSFMDAIKKSVLAGFNTDITTAQIVMSLLLALAAGLFILLVYRLTMRGIAFNRSFEITLLLVTTISGMIVLTITSNLALSLGMVGALSIVRFRTALKETSDTAFMFWAVAAGITAGAGFFLITLIGCLFIGLVVILAVRITKNVARPYLLVVRSVSGDTNSQVEKLLEQHHINRRLSSVVQNERYAEIIYEVSVSSAQQRLVAAVRALQGVMAVSLVDCRN